MSSISVNVGGAVAKAEPAPVWASTGPGGVTLTVCVEGSPLCVHANLSADQAHQIRDVALRLDEARVVKGDLLISPHPSLKGVTVSHMSPGSWGVFLPSSAWLELLGGGDHSCSQS